MHEAIVSTKGQIVIPQELRERYHLKPKTQARWIDTGGVLMLVPSSKGHLKELRGFLKHSGLTQKVLKKERSHEKRK